MNYLDRFRRILKDSDVFSQLIVISAEDIEAVPNISQFEDTKRKATCDKIPAEVLIL